MTLRCGVCNKFTGKDSPTCTGPCKRSFHLDCAVDYFKADRAGLEKTSSFLCGICVTITGPRLASPHASLALTQLPTTTCEKSPLSLADILSEIKSSHEVIESRLTNAIDTLSSKIAESSAASDLKLTSMQSSLQSSLKAINATIDKMRSEMSELKNKQIAMSNEIVELESKVVTLQSENASLRDSLNKQAGRLGKTLAWQQADELTISGLTEAANESLAELTVSCFSAVGINTPVHTILDVHRLTNNKILVKLGSRRLASRILRASRSQRTPLLASSIRPYMAGERVFINPNIPRKLYRLFKEIRDWAKTSPAVKLVRIQDGAIVLFMNNGTSERVIICNEAEFIAFRNSSSNGGSS